MKGRFANPTNFKEAGEILSQMTLRYSPMTGQSVSSDLDEQAETSRAGMANYWTREARGREYWPTTHIHWSTSLFPECNARLQESSFNTSKLDIMHLANCK